MKITLGLFLISLAARATIIYVDSGAVSTTNDSSHPTENVAWLPPLSGSDWITDGLLDTPDVTFTTEFSLSGAITGANLVVLSDDPTSVTLNGHTIASVSCTRCWRPMIDIFGFSQLAPFLIDGTNTLSIEVDGFAAALDFAGAVNDGQTPEASTTALIGAGLIALSHRLRRRK